MIKHFSKWFELVPLPDRSNEGAKYAFFNVIFSRFGAIAKIFIDQGTKLCGELEELSEKALIDHHMTSQDHFELDGLTEWMVKWGL